VIDKRIAQLRARSFLAAAVLVGSHGLGHAASAPGNAVDLELVLAVDVSGSMDPTEQRVQRNGYVQAFRSPDVLKAITSGPYGRIAVTYVEWSSAYFQQVVLPWHIISDAEDATAFADALARAPIGRDRSTSISGGLIYAESAFDSSPVQSDRRTIDVSGDGANNDGAPVAPVRDRVVGEGITINGLPIMLDPTPIIGDSGVIGLEDYYSGCVIGGPGAFEIPIFNLAQFQTAIQRKLILEIASVQPRVIPVASGVATSAAIDCLAGEKSRGRNGFP
jgi:Protein of unknown function (DUF1194)